MLNNTTKEELMKLTKSQKENRGMMINEMIKKYGLEKVTEWLNDPIKLRIINLMAAS